MCASVGDQGTCIPALAHCPNVHTLTIRVKITSEKGPVVQQLSSANTANRIQFKRVAEFLRMIPHTFNTINFEINIFDEIRPELLEKARGQLVETDAALQWLIKISPLRRVHFFPSSRPFFSVAEERCLRDALLVLSASEHLRF